MVLGLQYRGGGAWVWSWAVVGGAWVWSWACAGGLGVWWASCTVDVLHAHMFASCDHILSANPSDVDIVTPSVNIRRAGATETLSVWYGQLIGYVCYQL